MNTPTSTARIDVREVPPRERHPRIFNTFSNLRAGEAMELVNDHDPRPLHEQFKIQIPGQFAWEYLQQGPDMWRVAITRVKAGHGQGQCCGSCGGG